MRQNVEAVIGICGGDTNRWRPHVKTTKSTALWRDLIAKGITNFKCATPREVRNPTLSPYRPYAYARGWEGEVYCGTCKVKTKNGLPTAQQCKKRRRWW